MNGNLSAETPQWEERPVTFSVSQETCVGILTTPALERPVTHGVIFLAGGEQYRVAAHRLYVDLARSLAVRGVVCLRFDVRGMGDSTGSATSFENQDADIAGAVAHLLASQPSIVQVALCGLCDGATSAALFLARQQRTDVKRLLLINPWVRNPQTYAATQLKERYWRRIWSKDTLIRAIKGQIGLKALASLISLLQKSVWFGSENNGKKADFRRLVLSTLKQQSVSVFLSTRDATAQEFAHFLHKSDPVLSRRKKPNISVNSIEDGDHTLTRTHMRDQLLTHILRSIHQS